MKLFQILLQIQTPSDTATDTTGTERTMETLSIWELLMSGGWYIMIPLVILSILAVYVFIERYLAISKATKEEKDLMDRVRDHIHDGRIDSARNLCDTHETPISRMLYKGIQRIGKPMKDINASIENVAKLEIYKLERNLSVLATIAGAAPMIGFLGTVIGMIRTFHEMKISGQGIEIEQLSGGIMQAMVTTCTGLVIGIIAYIAYNILVTRMDRVVHHMEASSIEFMDILERSALNPDKSSEEG